MWLEFVTGRGGAGFHAPGPALTTGRGGYFGGDLHPAPVRGESLLIPWMGPFVSTCFYGDPSVEQVGPWTAGGNRKITPSALGHSAGPGGELGWRPVFFGAPEALERTLDVVSRMVES